MQSPQMPYRTALSACAAFFAGPGIFYGMLTSRMPALKAQAGVSEGEIGLLLLSLGLSALVMLLMSSLLVTKFGSRRVLGWGSLVCMAGIPAAAFAADFWVLWGAFILFGFGMGLWDVSMNVQGMGVERRYGKSSMLILHASYSTGSVIGAASGAFFAAAELAVVPHFLTVFVVYLAVRAWAKTKLYEDQPAGGAAKKSGSIFGLPLIVYVFGLTPTPLKGRRRSGEVSCCIPARALTKTSRPWPLPRFPVPRLPAACWVNLCVRSWGTSGWRFSGRSLPRLPRPSCISRKAPICALRRMRF